MRESKSTKPSIIPKQHTMIKSNGHRATASRSKGRLTQVPSSYRSPVRMTEEGTFSNEIRPLLGENRDGFVPISKDERYWVKLPVRLGRFVTTPLRPVMRYDEAYPGRLPAMFAVIGVVIIVGLFVATYSHASRAAKGPFSGGLV